MPKNFFKEVINNFTNKIISIRSRNIRFPRRIFSYFNNPINFAIVVIIIIIICIGSFITINNIYSLDSKTSLGEDKLLAYIKRDQQVEIDIDDGGKAFQDKNYKVATEKFERWHKKEPDNPEALIYLNNAKALDPENNKNGVLKIAATVPADGSIDVAYEMLRGVAQVQNEINEINEKGGINGKRLIVEIANDNNDKNQAKQIAEKLSNDPDIWAVVGSNKSEASIEAAKVYKEKNIVMISPTSDAQEFIDISQPPIFRTLPNPSDTANQLIKYIQKNSFIQKIAICKVPNSGTSNSFEKAVEKIIYNINVVIVQAKCDITKQSELEIYKIKNADAVLLLPSVNTIEKAVETVKKIKTVNQNMILLGSPTLHTYRVLCPKINGEIEPKCSDVEKMILAIPWDTGTPEAKTLLAKMKTDWHVPPTWRSIMSYKATSIIVKGLEQQQQQQPRQETLSSFIKTIIDNKTIDYEKPGLNNNPSLVRVQKGEYGDRSFDFIPNDEPLQRLRPAPTSSFP